MDLSSWALSHLSRLLPLDDESLKQIISYSEGLPPREAAKHLQELLGDSAQALEFITSFNNRRAPKSSLNSRDQQPSREDLSEVPRTRPKKKKASGRGALPPPRQPENYGDTSGAYLKRDEDDYMPRSSKAQKPHHKPNAFELHQKLDAIQKAPVSPATSAPPVNPPAPKQSSKPPPSASGALISDFKPSRTSSPKPKAKVTVQGGTPMHGASTAIDDLDSAIRALEIQTNPSLSSSQDNSKRACNCMATRHPLLEAAPNCLNCGKIICIKEGIGPCTFCSHPLLSSSEIQTMVRALREERGKEKMALNNTSQKRAEVSSAPRPFSTPKAANTPIPSTPASDSDNENEKLAKAKAHRDKLLAFQAQNARRTQVHDEAADFDVPSSGLSMWASPHERAMQLKRQQKALREQEWNARPEYEKRTMVASIDLSGRKVVKKMAAVERPKTPESDFENTGPADHGKERANRSGGGAFSRNPLLGALIRPTIKVDAKGKGPEREKKQTWRRVQDDYDNNEQWILDGGIQGAKIQGSEPDICG